MRGEYTLQAGPKTVTNTTRTEQCVSLGLGQFLDRIAVQEQDRKLEPFFSFLPTAGSAAHACCKRALCSILHVGGSRGLRVPVCGATGWGSRKMFPPVTFVVDFSVAQH